MVLQQEQEEYQREGIQWEHIDYFNNMVICQLIDQAHKGIIAIMDEACLNVGKITDPMLLEEMDRKLKGHKHYNSRRTDPTNKALTHGEDFQVKHYAGDVIYTIEGFIEKNRDTLFQDFKRLLYNSSNTVLRSMWPEGSEHITKTTKRPLTAGTLFKNSMLALMKTIHSKEPHYVRCIKPNDAKSPVLFDQKLVEHQVAAPSSPSSSPSYPSSYITSSSTRSPTWASWRTCGCGGRGSPTGRSTAGSSAGTR